MKQSVPNNPVALIAHLLQAAAEANASDLYWLPNADGAIVRMRRNGRQEHLAQVPSSLAEQALTHLKVRAGLLTYKTKIAQDGRLDIPCGDRTIAARVAAMPTLAGERVTIRLQTQSAQVRRLDQLNLDDPARASLQRLIADPDGMILLTGPTGSGKTTTIYAIIQSLLDADDDPASIITVEDPVECRVPGVSQTAVRRDDPDWNYAEGLRAALRQDLKTLVVGEIRDVTVAHMAIDAALSGHRVVSTFHGGDVAAVYARLLHLGIEPFLLGAALRAVIAQRLVYPENGEPPIPVLAIHRLDDDWREFLCTKPSLAAMRARIRETPGADLAAVAAALAETGRIPRILATRIGDRL